MVMAEVPSTPPREQACNEHGDATPWTPPSPSQSPHSPPSPSQLTCKSSPFSRKQRIRCMFCRGASCNRCGLEAYLQLQAPALDHVHSSWVTESIIAMQRPSDDLIDKSNLIDQFISLGVGAVFNLTEPGEHPYCGSGLIEATGFPYTPERLMAKGINHFNYSWPDMTAPPLPMMLDIVQVASHQLSEKRKVAVHCHAGYGRTGVAIACILVATLNLDPAEAITTVRTGRPGALQTKTQTSFVSEFAVAWRAILEIFPATDSAAARLKSIAQTQRDQQWHLSLEELSGHRLRWYSKLLHTVFGGDALARWSASPLLLASCLTGLSLPLAEGVGADSAPSSCDATSSASGAASLEASLSAFKADLNQDKWDSLQAALASGDAPDAAATLQLVADWFECRSDSVLDADAVAKLVALWGDGGQNTGTDPPAESLSGHIKVVLTQHTCRAKRAVWDLLSRVAVSVTAAGAKADSTSAKLVALRLAALCLPSSLRAGVVEARALSWPIVSGLVGFRATEQEQQQLTEQQKALDAVAKSLVIVITNLMK